MLRNFKASELIIFAFVIILIFISEYEFMILKNENRAIFIGLWPPTILGLLIYINLKRNQ
jgi:hypothetical protein